MRRATRVIQDLRWTLTLAGASLVIFLLLGPVPAGLIMDPAVAFTREPWRLFSGHLTHSDDAHLFWDLTGLLLVGSLYEPLLKRRLGGLLVAGSLGICAGISVIQPTVIAYCGLSGLINLIVGAGAVAAWRTERDWPRVLFALAVAAKLLVEQLTDAALFTQTAWPPLQAAHLIGFMLGVLYAALVVPSPPKAATESPRQIVARP